MSIKVFSFLVEPSIYTLDLIENIYYPMKIEYVFLHGSAEIAKSKSNNMEIISLEKSGWFKKIILLAKIKKRFDLVIFNGYSHPEFVIFFILNLLSLKKSVIAIESDTRYRKRRGIKGLIKRIYLGMIFSNKYILGLAGGNYIHKDLFKNYGMEEENILLMPMMVNNARFYKNNMNKPAERGFTYLFVGRMIHLKQIEMLILSFLQNFEDNLDVHLNIVGNGELYEPLKSKYCKYTNIHFKGAKFDQDLVKEYHNANVLVLPSDCEQWGLVVNEALSAGLPVICSDEVGAIHDLVEGKDTGLIFRHNDPEDLSEKMLLLYKDRKTYKKYSRNAQKLMKEYWNYDLYMECIKKSIQRVEQILGKNEDR